MKILLIIAMLIGTASAAVKSSFMNVPVKRVYDGDTFYVDFIGTSDVLGKGLRIRTRELNTPELRTPEGKRAKADLEKKLFNAKEIDLINCKRGNYYRLVCSVFADGILLEDKK